MKAIRQLLPIAYIKALDFLVKQAKVYPNRAEAIRVAIRNLLNEELGPGWHKNFQ